MKKVNFIIKCKNKDLLQEIDELLLYQIQDRQSGVVIEKDLSKKEAEKLLKQYEESDLKDDIYEENFYEIVIQKI